MQPLTTMKKHFITFYSPGTFVAEETTKPVEKWDVDTAVELAKTIKERHGAVPYGFRFSTRERTAKQLDSKVTKTSALYWLGGKVETLEEIKKRKLPSEKILLSNMECNGWDRVITNTNSWKWTQPLEKNDVVLDVKL